MSHHLQANIQQRQPIHYKMDYSKQQTDSGYLHKSPSKSLPRQHLQSVKNSHLNTNIPVQQDFITQKGINPSQMTPVSNHQPLQYQYHQNTHFLSQINKDKGSGGQMPQQGIFGSSQAHNLLNQSERNNNKMQLLSQQAFQNGQNTFKTSSKIHLHESNPNLVHLPNDPQITGGHQYAHQHNLKRVNQSTNSQKYIFSQLNQVQSQMNKRSCFQQNQEVIQRENKQRNNSSNEYKQYRQRMHEKKKESTLQNSGIKLDNNRDSLQQQSMNNHQQIKMPVYFINQKVSSYPDTNSQQLQSPQPQQKGQFLAQIGPKGQVQLVQSSSYQQQLQQYQLLQQIQSSQKMQKVLQANQIPHNYQQQKDQRHPNQVFSNQAIQAKAANMDIQGQQYIRNSKNLMDGAEQLLIQKQFQAQMMQNGQTLQQSQVPSGQSASRRQAQQNQVREYRHFQAYQQAFFNNAMAEAQQQNNNESKNIFSDLPQSTPVRQNPLVHIEHNSGSESRANNERELNEFQDYLQQQQEQQNAECSALQYAHSKKQRELIKAKEYSENIRSGAEQENEPSQINQSTDQDINHNQIQKDQSEENQHASPRDIACSTQNSSQNHHQLKSGGPLQHARSQSGNRERNRDNLTAQSQPQAELTREQLMHLRPPPSQNKDSVFVSRSTSNPLNENWGSSKGQSTTTATTGGAQGPSAYRAGSIESKASKNSEDGVNSEIEKVEEQQLSKVSEESFIDDGGMAEGDGITTHQCYSTHHCPSDSEEAEGMILNDEIEQVQEQPKSVPQKKAINKNKNVVEEEEKVEKKPSVPRAPWRAKKEEKEKALAEAAAAVKPKKKINKILGSMPANWEEEETKFFDLNYEYDPQFTYDSPATNRKFLKMFPAPKYEYLPQAKQIIDKFLEIYGSESNYFETEGRVLNDKEEVEKIIWDYLDEHGPEVRAVGRINFSSKNVASTSVTYDNWTNKIRINVQVPIQYREGRIRGVLHHEIGSHYLRRFNEVQQPWFEQRKKYGIKSAITIEEGSGCINMFLEQSKDPTKWCFLFKPALNYYMCCKASEMSFKDLFNDLEKYVDNPRQRYKYVLRVKRGLTDTSQPGGLYKDQVYLEGALKLLENRKDIDWHLFYSAKLNIEDLKRPKLIKKLKKENIVLPKFVLDQEDYKKRLDVIAKHNFID